MHYLHQNWAFLLHCFGLGCPSVMLLYNGQWELYSATSVLFLFSRKIQNRCSEPVSNWLKEQQSQLSGENHKDRRSLIGHLYIPVSSSEYRICVLVIKESASFFLQVWKVISFCDVCVCTRAHKYVCKSSRVEFLLQFCPSVGRYRYSHRYVHVVAITTKHSPNYAALEWYLCISCCFSLNICQFIFNWGSSIGYSVENLKFMHGSVVCYWNCDLIVSMTNRNMQA
jgi:hypothetical protein